MPLQNLLTEARRALGVHLHTTAGSDDVHAVSKTRAASYGVLRINEALTAPTGDVLARNLAPLAMPKDNGVLSIAGAVAQASLVAAAGAKIIEVSTAPEPSNPAVQTWGKVEPVPVLYSRPERFSVIEAAKFVELADGTSVTVSALPVSSAQVEWNDAPSHAVSFTVSRREQKSLSELELQFRIEQALTKGLARLADQVLLTSIAAATPAAFTLAAAAAAGLRFGELKALIGTAGIGAAVGPDGVLRASGIPAELTDATAGTVIGAFSRSAVAIDQEIRLICDRRSTQGDLEITAHVSLRALVPDAGAFFRITA